MLRALLLCFLVLLASADECALPYVDANGTLARFPRPNSGSNVILFPYVLARGMTPGLFPEIAVQSLVEQELFAETRGKTTRPVAEIAGVDLTPLHGENPLRHGLTPVRLDAMYGVRSRGGAAPGCFEMRVFREDTGCVTFIYSYVLAHPYLVPQLGRVFDCAERVE